MQDFETDPAGTADLVKRLRMIHEWKLGGQAANRIEQLEAENKRLGDLYDDTCYYHTPDGRAQFHARKISALEAELTRANAATAAAYEVAAREVECGCGAGPCQDTANCAAKDAADIRALATPDQTAALDAVRAEARAQGMREAAEYMQRYSHTHMTVNEILAAIKGAKA